MNKIKKLYQDKWLLFFAYIVDKKSSNKIARICNCSSRTILNWLIKFKIPIRSNNESTKAIWKNPKIRNKYISTFNNIDYREKMSRSQKGKILSEEHKKNIKESHNTLEYREKMSNIVKELWEDQEYREKNIKSIKIAQSKKEVKKKISKTHKENWKDLEYRKRQIEIHDTIECKKKRSKSMKEKWRDPKFKNKIMTSLNSPDVKEKISNAMKKNWQDLEYRNKISDSHKEFYKTNEGLKRRKELRRARLNQVFPVKDTKIEVKLQNFLKELNIKFEKHKPITDIEHYYQCDIYIPFLNLVVEADGEYWHGHPRFEPLNNHQIKKKKLDKIRTEELKEQGYNILRLWESEINNMIINDFKIILEVHKYNE